MRERLRQEDGIGLVELVLALALINVALLAMVAAFNGGALSILRASRTTSAAVMAEKQMELYRSLVYVNIGLDSSLVSAAATDTLHTAETTEWAGGSQVVPANGWCTTTKTECKPVQASVTGPDGRSYRIDTYIRSVTPASGRPVKRVTVAVRRAGSTGAPLAQLQSAFDTATGCVAVGDPNYPC